MNKMLETGYLILLKTHVLNVHCDLISDSLVDGQETDIVFSFGTGTLHSSYNFVMEPQRVFFNPVNKTSIIFWLMIEAVSMIGIMPFLKCNFN